MSDQENLLNLAINAPLEASATKQRRKTATYLTIASTVAIAHAIHPELALAAAKFDINAGVTAATTPLINGISDHWGKAVLLTGCGGAIIGEGDARQRAVRAAITSAAAGGVVLALLAMLT